MSRAGGWLAFLVLVTACCKPKTATTVADDGAPSDTIGEDVILPDVEWPADLPASRWEAYYDEALLAANGFARTPAAWRTAIGSPTDVVREAAYRMLADLSDATDEGLLRRGLADASTTARAHAAYGLVRLGDPAARDTLAALAAGPVEFGEYGALVAACRLASLGDPRGFATVRAGLALPTAAAAALPALLPFIDLQGQPSGSSTVDVWPLYAQALAGDDQLQTLALGALAEKPHAAARPLLTAYLAGSPGPTHRAQAEALLARL